MATRYDKWEKRAADLCLAAEELQAEMQDYYDERSEKWQESDMASTVSEQIDSIEEAMNALNSINFS